MPGGYEYRKFTRVRVALPVIIADGEGNTFDGRIQDLTVGGMSLVCTDSLNVGEEYRLTIKPDPHTEVEVRGKVVRAEHNDYGVEFTGIARSGFETLRNIIVNKAPEPAEVELEIVTHADYLPEFY